VQYGLLWLLALVLWLGSFINPSGMTEPVNVYLSPGYVLLFKWFSGYHLAGLIIAFLLLVSGALIFNLALVRYDLVPKNTLVPALVLIITFSHDPAFLNLQPSLVASVLIIVALNYIFSVYTKEEAYDDIYYAAFLISIASFFYYQSVLILLFIFLTFFVYRIYFWREWIIVILGFITPYILLWTYFFWTDELHIVFDAYTDFFSGFTFLQFNQGYPVLGIIISIMILLLFLFSFVSLASNLNEKVISVRKRYWSVIWLFIIALLILIFSFEKYGNPKLLLMIPMSVMIAYKLSDIKKLFWFELYAGILTLLILLNNLFYYL
jgi:hypothetical protein